MKRMVRYQKVVIKRYEKFTCERDETGNEHRVSANIQVSVYLIFTLELSITSPSQFHTLKFELI